jgi:3-hydroxyacyl-[acyl-carrier-protein] dehydratase
MPGVLLIESMAQTSGWLVIGLTKFERMPFLAAVREAKLRTFVTPGQELMLTARIIHEGSGFMITRAAIEVDGKAVADSELTFRLAPFPHPSFRTGMEQVAAAIGFPDMDAVTAVPEAAAPAQEK